MTATVTLSLPEEQLKLLERVGELTEKLLEFQNRKAWLSEDEAADRLRVSKPTIQKWRKEGWLRHCRDGEKVIMYRVDQLDQDIEKKLGVVAYR